MRTEDLVSLMVASQRPVDTGFLPRATALAAAAALAVTITLILVTIGNRADIATMAAMVAASSKAALGATLAAGALMAFTRSLRPGARPARLGWLVMLAPAVVLAVASAVALSQAAPAAWSGMVFGRDWLACLVAVPLYAMAPFALMAAVARRGAPVDPARSGLLAGLASGGLAIMAYSIHCREDAAPFIATWYPLAIVVSGAMGALIMPRVARW